MLTSIVLAGLLAGEPVPVLRAHGKPAIKAKVTVLPKKRPIVDSKAGSADPATQPLNPAAYDYYPETLGIRLYDVKDAQGKFGYELNSFHGPRYIWEGLVAVRDTHRGTSGVANLCIYQERLHNNRSTKWNDPVCILMIRLPGPIAYDEGNFVLKGSDTEWSRYPIRPRTDDYNNGTLHLCTMAAPFTKISWAIHADVVDMSFGNIVVELTEESLASIRIMAQASLDFAEKREDEGRQRLDQMIRLQDQSPIKNED